MVVIMKPKSIKDIDKLGIMNLSELPIEVAYSEEKNSNDPTTNASKTITSAILFLVPREIKNAPPKIINANTLSKSLLSCKFSVGSIIRINEFKVSGDSSAE